MFKKSLLMVGIFLFFNSGISNNKSDIKVKAVKLDFVIGSGKHRSQLTMVASTRFVKVCPSNSTFYFLFEMSNSAKRDEDKITIVDYNKQEYIVLTTGEIKSMIKLRQMLDPVNIRPIQCHLTATNCEDMVADMSSKKYISTIEGQKAILYLSKFAETILKEHTSYAHIINSIESLDLESLGIADVSFTTIKSVLSKAKTEGFLTKLELDGSVEYEVISLQKVTMPSSAFDLPLNNLSKRGIEALLERL